MVTTGILMNKLVSGKVKARDPVDNVLYRQFCKIKLDTSLGHVSKVLEKDHFVLIVHTQRRCEYFIAIWYLHFHILKNILSTLFVSRRWPRSNGKQGCHHRYCNPSWLAQLHHWTTRRLCCWNLDWSWRKCSSINYKPCEQLSCYNIWRIQKQL